MKMYIKKNGDVFGEIRYREDFDSLPKENYNAEGWYEFEPTPSPQVDLNKTTTYNYFLDNDNVVRYAWTVEDKTGEELIMAVRDKWNIIRSVRNDILKSTDYTQILDSPFTPEKRLEWSQYRQSLRDITFQSDPFNIQWPTSPDGKFKGDNIGVIRV